MRTDAVVVIGTGCQSAVGLSAPATAAAARAGLAAFTEHPFVVDGRGERMIVARVPSLPEEACGADRFIKLLIPALQEALGPLMRDAHGQLSLSLGLPGARPGLPEALGKRITGALLEAGIRFDGVEIFATGHAAGLMALEAGRRRAAHGQLGVVAAVDSYLEPETLEWLDEVERLKCERNPGGLIPGEAAGVCVLASEAGATRNGWPALSQLDAVSIAREANPLGSDGVNIGMGLTESIRAALQVLQSPDVKVNEIICDMNGEPYRAAEYGFTLVRVAKRFVDATAFRSPADCWGDVGAASGPLFVILATAAFQKGFANGPRALLWTSSDTGERASAMLSSTNDHSQR
jgi:3-oxoacyl-[acyl-carrier-protein] synthase-1